MPNEDYVKKLRKDYEEIADKVERGMLPLVARIPAIENAVSEYVLAQDEDFVRKRKKGGHVPIQFRDSNMLDRFADLVLYEELTWSHPDKMSIVEYPVMSDWQAKERRGKTSFPGEVTHDDRQYNGRRKSHSIGKNGEINVTNHRMPNFEDADIDALIGEIDVNSMVESAKLTARQRQAINLIYFEGKTQEQAAKIMGVSRATVRVNEDRAFAKIRKILKT